MLRIPSDVGEDDDEDEGGLDEDGNLDEEAMLNEEKEDLEDAVFREAT